MLLAYLGFVAFVMRQQLNGNVGKVGRVARREQLDASLSFADVAGCDGARRDVQEIVTMLTDPGRFVAAGARAPKGVLLVGPPGTGKTLLARATAAEAGVPFIYCSGSDFVEIFSGRGAARVRGLFERTSKAAPCILFIDEV